LTETEIAGTIDKDSRINGFSVEGMKVFIEDDGIRVEHNGESYEFSRDEFGRRPRDVMGRIIGIGRGGLN